MEKVTCSRSVWCSCENCMSREQNQQKLRKTLKKRSKRADAPTPPSGRRGNEVVVISANYGTGGDAYIV